MDKGQCGPTPVVHDPTDEPSIQMSGHLGTGLQVTNAGQMILLEVDIWMIMHSPLWKTVGGVGKVLAEVIVDTGRGTMNELRMSPQTTIIDEYDDSNLMVEVGMFMDVGSQFLDYGPELRVVIVSY